MDYYQIADLEQEGSRIALVRLPSSQAVFAKMAAEMVQCIARNNAQERPTVMILPVGPVGQYPYFAELVNRQGLSLRRCWFFNMDEYLQEDGSYLPKTHRLSFRGFMNRALYGAIAPELLPPPEQRIFPDPVHPARTDALLESLGGAELCLGGIGLNGHLAFNEAQPELTVAQFAALPSRVVSLSPETRAANAIGDLGGALEQMPRQAVTLGMGAILNSRAVRLGVFRDWHRAVCRRAAFGEKTAAFPVTLLQGHPDVRLYVNDVAATLPY